MENELVRRDQPVVVYERESGITRFVESLFAPETEILDMLSPLVREGRSGSVHEKIRIVIYEE